MLPASSIEIDFHMKHLTFLTASTVLLLITSSATAADCFDLASRYQGINSTVLRAIAMMENPRCDARISKNTNGSVDVGCMQINSVHFTELARHGVLPADLLDQCKNIYVGAWHYKKMVRKYGNTWKAIGAYHSETPHLRDRYAQGVYRILQKHGYL
jgi:soluble lytic murein transglycosylase-like protein